VKNIFITFAKMGLWSTEFRSQTELIEEKGWYKSTLLLRRYLLKEEERLKDI
jgi:hypothetical protein